MFDYLRSRDPLPRAVRRFARDRDRAIAYLEHARDASQSEEEIAAKMGLSLKRYRRLPGDGACVLARLLLHFELTLIDATSNLGRFAASVWVAVDWPNTA